MSSIGALGAKGLCSEGFVVVPEECKYCKLDRFKTKEQATCFLKENHRIQNIIIITEKEYVDAWNGRFANETMKAAISLGQQVIANNYCQLFDEGVQTNHEESSTAACRQSGELFSKGEGSQRKAGTCEQLLHCNNHDDILAQIGFAPSVIEIPDEVWQKVIEGAAIASCPDMAGKWKLSHSLCNYCNHSIDCKLCGVDILTQVHKVTHLINS